MHRSLRGPGNLQGPEGHHGETFSQTPSLYQLFHSQARRGEHLLCHSDTSRSNQNLIELLPALCRSWRCWWGVRGAAARLPHVGRHRPQGSSAHMQGPSIPRYSQHAPHPAVLLEFSPSICKDDPPQSYDRQTARVPTMTSQRCSLQRPMAYLCNPWPCVKEPSWPESHHISRTLPHTALPRALLAKALTLPASSQNLPHPPGQASRFWQPTWTLLLDTPRAGHGDFEV